MYCLTSLFTKVSFGGTNKGCLVTFTRNYCGIYYVYERLNVLAYVTKPNAKERKKHAWQTREGMIRWYVWERLAWCPGPKFFYTHVQRLYRRFIHDFDAFHCVHVRRSQSLCRSRCDRDRHFLQQGTKTFQFYVCEHLFYFYTGHIFDNLSRFTNEIFFKSVFWRNERYPVRREMVGLCKSQRVAPKTKLTSYTIGTKNRLQTAEWEIIITANKPSPREINFSR